MDFVKLSIKVAAQLAFFFVFVNGALLAFDLMEGKDIYELTCDSRFERMFWDFSWCAFGYLACLYNFYKYENRRQS